MLQFFCVKTFDGHTHLRVRACVHVRVCVCAHAHACVRKRDKGFYEYNIKYIARL